MEARARVPIWFVAANMLLVLVAFTAGIALGGRRQPSLPEPQATALGLVHQEIVRSHVEPQDPQVLLDRAIAGMVKGLDPYSEYVPPQAVSAFEEDTTGSYQGIGMVPMPGEVLVVRFPMPGGPAERAGLLPGDLILKVDGKAVAAPDAIKLLRGPSGSQVVITIRRGSDEREVTVERGDVQKRSVKWARLLDAGEGLGYLYITDFHRDTAGEFARAVAALQALRPEGLRGLIIDLRFNGGGLLNECVELCRQLIPEGNIVSTKRRGSEVERYDARREACTLPDLPLVVLVNGHSASASEVMAGALQDHKRAAIVGVRTYGKGYVNTIYSWKNLPFRLKLTTAHYYTPSGRNIERPHGTKRPAPDEGGIIPDTAVDMDDKAAEDIYRHLYETEVPERYRAAVAAVADELGVTLPDLRGPDQDPQLAAALTELRGRLTGNGR